MKFCEEQNFCLLRYEKGRRTIVMGDMNPIAGNMIGMRRDGGVSEKGKNLKHIYTE